MYFTLHSNVFYTFLRFITIQIYSFLRYSTKITLKIYL